MRDDDFFDDIVDPFDLYDLDGDGEHSSFERAMALDELEREERKSEDDEEDEEDSDIGYEDDSDEDDSDEDDSDEDDSDEDDSDEDDSDEDDSDENDWDEDDWDENEDEVDSEDEGLPESDENIFDDSDNDEPKEELTGENEESCNQDENSTDNSVSEFIPIKHRVKEKKRTDEWKQKYTEQDGCGVDIDKYKFEIDYKMAVYKVKEELYKHECEAKAKARREALRDKTEYTYYGVLLPNNERVYHYFSYEPLELGNIVIVPVGKFGEEIEGTVVSVEKHLKISIPFPIEKMKYIIRKY